jgi:hypothetical protein
MTEFTVPAGTEAWKCQDFGDPFGGQPVDIKGWDSTMTAGSHHLTLYNQPGATDGPLSDCPDGVTAPTYAFGAQSEKTTFAFPDTVGEHIPAGLGYTMNSHYVNATAAAIHTNVSVTAFVAAPGVVTQYAGAFEGVLLSIAVPPGRPSVVVGGSCTLPQDLNVIAVSGHMHHRGSNFNLTSGGTSLLQTDEIAAAPSVVSPPLLLKAGADISWSCTYTNPTSNLLTYGNSAWANVMCNTILVFYPIQDTNNGLLDCTL